MFHFLSNSRNCVGLCLSYPIKDSLSRYLNMFNISVSLDNILTPVICIMSGFLQQKFGPLRVLQFACLPYTAAWVAAALADSHQTLYLSR